MGGGHSAVPFQIFSHLLFLSDYAEFSSADLRHNTETVLWHQRTPAVFDESRAIHRQRRVEFEEALRVSGERGREKRERGRERERGGERERERERDGGGGEGEGGRERESTGRLYCSGRAAAAARQLSRQRTEYRDENSNVCTYVCKL